MSAQNLLIALVPFRRIVLPVFAVVLFAGFSAAAPATAPTEKEAPAEASVPADPAEPEKAVVPAKEAKAEVTKEKPPEKTKAAEPVVNPDDQAAVEGTDAAEVEVAVARPVSADPIQIYGWQEYVFVEGVEEKLKAKLDTGARTSSIHAEEKELFERDGKKWVRFIVTDPTVEKPVRTRIEAPLVRTARIKEPGGESMPREVVRLRFQIGDRKIRAEFTLNNRVNMLSPVLIGRTLIKDLGLVDSGRAYLADKKIFR